MAVYVLATLDTKGPEGAFVRDRLRELGLDVVLVDCGSGGPPTVAPDLDRQAVLAAAGLAPSGETPSDRGMAVDLAARGAASLVAQAYARGELEGVLALGGSAGTTIGTAAMRSLPLGVPKVMVSTLASGQVRPWVRDKDIAMFNTVVDLAGLNRVSRQVLASAVAALAGMVRWRLAPQPADRPLVAATMFGVTTPCVMRARQKLEAAGYEVLVFHATGNGGQAMESLIREGVFAGVLDVTTTELADELVGGILSAGPDRLTAAASCGVPQVVSVGAVDMVNFGPRESVPPRWAERKLHAHNANITLMRTTPEENAQLGEEIGRKVAASRGPAVILLPRQGVSALDREGQPFDDPAARKALFEGIRRTAGQVPVVEVDAHLNDPAFADAAAEALLRLLAAREKARRLHGTSS
jgi:uncharacterized protein (UPF0261 family)